MRIVPKDKRRVEIGDVFEHCEVIGVPFYVKRGKVSLSWVVVRCKCGAVIASSVNALLSGAKKSCGCARSDSLKAFYAKRANYRACATCGTEFVCSPSSGKKYCGQQCRDEARSCVVKVGRTRLHNLWCGMKSRCRTTRKPTVTYYKDRGITVCDEWQNSYAAFQSWALRNGYDQSLELDRIDNAKGYNPSNCRWVTRRQQMQNTTKRADAKTSKYKGVSWHSQIKRWRAQIVDNGNPCSIGCYKTEVEAARAYDAEALERFGDHGCTNASMGLLP